MLSIYTACAYIYISHLAPAYGKILGPITPLTPKQHPCFASRVFGPFILPESDQETQGCFPSCPDSTTLHDENATIDLTASPQRTPPSQHRSSPPQSPTLPP